MMINRSQQYDCHFVFSAMSRHTTLTTSASLAHETIWLEPLFKPWPLRLESWANPPRLKAREKKPLEVVVAEATELVPETEETWGFG